MADYFKITSKECEERDIELDDIMDKLPKQLQEAINEEVENLKFNILLNLMESETPIEQILGFYIFLTHKAKNDLTFGSIGFEVLDIEKQAEIEIDKDKQIRVDFLISIANYDMGKHFTFVIECDGHEYHEKTKEQAQKDKERDRELLFKKIIPIHFTGSEIVKDPAGCAHKAFGIMYNWCDAFAKLAIIQNEVE